MENIILITEDISEPIDEGIKKYSFKLAQFLIESKHAKIFTSKSNPRLNSQHNLPSNKFFFSISFFKKLKVFHADIIIYLPNSSSTLMSFLRLKIISLITHKKTALISIQKRNHSKLSRVIIKYILRPNLIFVFSEREEKYYRLMRLNVEITSAGVNTKEYFPISEKNKMQLRKSLNINGNKKIILHVGHINKDRNIEILKHIADLGHQVVIIGSTCFTDDEKLKSELTQCGIIIISTFLDNINEYYQISDLYIFPVQNNNSVIEFPLSILEAMACNLPVLTTKFGSLPNHFKETNFFKYFHDKNELLAYTKILLSDETISCNNNEQIEKSYTWEGRFNDLINKIYLI